MLYKRTEYYLFKRCDVLLKAALFVLYRPVFMGYSLFLNMVGSAYLKQDMTQRAGVSKSCGGVCVCVYQRSGVEIEGASKTERLSQWYLHM